MNLIKIRDAEMRVIALLSLGVVAERCERLPLERCDLWRHARGSATVGITWADESFTLVDFSRAVDADRWLSMSGPLQACLEVH
jgi:hypothetical protein